MRTGMFWDTMLCGVAKVIMQKPENEDSSSEMLMDFC
jgi:hypothetical protein